MEEIQLLKKLIQIPSLSGLEGKLVQFIMDFCKENKLPARLVKGNVVIHLQGKDKTKALIFNAHLDTVSVGDKSKWIYRPYGKDAGQLVSGKMYGLGSSDDKAAIASMLLTAKELDKPPLDLWFCFVTHEETNGSGTENFLGWFKKQNYLEKYQKIGCIIGEPTNLTKIEIGHRGNTFVKLESYGISGHGGKRYHVKDLAIEKMIQALSKLKKVFKIWEKKYQHKFLGWPTLNITKINSKHDSINKIPLACEAYLDIRTTPKLHMTLDSLLKKYLNNLVKISYVHNPVPPGLTKTNSYLIELTKKISPSLKIDISLGSTDLVHFSKYGIETIVLGPGNKECIHRENEYVEVEKVSAAIKIYKKFIYAY